MKASQIIETLTSALALYGDHDVKLLDPESGDWEPVISVIKLHPYTGPHGCMNRAEPVDTFALTTVNNHATDLILP